jgi:hypothetical protein
LPYRFVVRRHEKRLEEKFQWLMNRSEKTEMTKIILIL